MNKMSPENVLLLHGSVVDCFICRGAEPSRAFSAFVVLRGRLDVQALTDHFKAAFGDDCSVDFIPVSRIPTTSDGAVDREELERIRETRELVSAGWERELNAHPDIQRAAVAFEEAEPDVFPLHIGDLLPEWNPDAFLSAQMVQADADSAPADSRACMGVSMAEGPEPILEDDAPSTLAEALIRCAHLHPDHGITYIHGDGSERFQSYAELLDVATCLLGGLQDLQLAPQSKIIFQFADNEDFIPAFWGCLLGGYVPVPIAVPPVFEAGNAVVEKLLNAWTMLKSPLILTSESISAPLRTVFQNARMAANRIATIESLKKAAPATSLSECQPDDLAVLLLTSGSTGIPKGVMLTHRNILSNVAASAQVNGFGAEDRSLNWLRLDHVGSLVRCSIRDIYVGSNQIHAPAELVLEHPLRLLDWIEQYAVTFAWAPNFALGLINKELAAAPQRKWDLSSLRSMLSVAEAIIPKTAQTFARLLAPFGFEPSMMHAAWGMSETCAAVTFSHNYLDQFPHEDYPHVEVGAPTAGFKLRIVDHHAQLVPEETIGKLEIKGPMVLSGYYENPDLNASEFTPDGWFKTGDLGYLKNGRLTVTGREKDIIIINGQNHYSHEIEAVIEETEGVLPSFTATCGLRQTGQDTDQLVVFFCCQSNAPEKRKALLKAVQSNIARKLGIQAHYLLPVDPAMISKTSVGKIQRLKMKQRFEEGEFDPLIKEIDLLLENQCTLPDWFYRPRWIRCEATVFQPLPTASRILVFLDELGLGTELVKKLTAQGHHCIAVLSADDFAQTGPDGFTVNPADPADYRQLIDKAYPSGLPDCILHCWLYQAAVHSIEMVCDLDAVQERGAYSLLHLVHALADRAAVEQSPMRVQVVSSFGQWVNEQDEELDYAKSPVLGLIKTIPKELPWMDCRHLDLVPGNVDGNGQAVLRELQVPQLEREVAYREGFRFVLRMACLDWAHQNPIALPFQDDRFYLITGGLGGVGFEIAQYLLTHHQSRLLLVGRSALDAGPGHERRGRRLAALQALDGEVDYATVDVCDQSAMEQLVERYEEHWQIPLGGVLHLAGNAPERLLVDETLESFAATLRAKVAGTWVLHQLIKDRPDRLFISMSSVISLFGGTSVGAYTASNTFLNQFQKHAQLNGYGQHYCFRSGTWSQIGVNEGYGGSDARIAQGQIAMSAQAGVRSLLIGLRYQLPDLIFGLDRKKRAVQVMCHNMPLWLQQPVAYLQTGLDPNGFERLTPPVGGGGRYRFQRVERIPLDQDGQVDRTFLPTLAQDLQRLDEPDTPTEQKLAEIWKEVLGLSAVHRTDNFFELGGTSLLAARLFILIAEAFGKTLPLASLFQAPTLFQLAQFVDQDVTDAELWNSLVPIRAEGDRPPLFFIHAGFGDVVGFEGLVRHLDNDWPVYALRPIDLGGHCEPLPTIEKMAEHYVGEIMKKFPRGPYYLVGHCTGGSVAYEMAQQLTAQGHEIGWLCMHDTPFPKYKNYLRTRFVYYSHHPLYKDGWFDAWYYISCIIYRVRPYQLLARVHRHAKALRSNKIEYLRNGLASCRDIFSRKKASNAMEANSGMPNPPNPDSTRNAPGLSKAYIDERFFECFLRAEQNYVPKPYEGRIDYFVTIQNTYAAAFKPHSLKSFRQTLPVHPETQVRFGWDKLARDAFRIHPVDCRHENMLIEPTMQLLGERMNEVLRGLV